MIAPVYTPTKDRSGRTVRIGAYTTLGSIANQKNWIQQVGPLVVGFDVYDDFFGWSGSTPYKRASSAAYAGGHIMTAVGFDDNLQCWIVKNSWGTGWGNSGWGLIAYGQCNIDAYAKYGLQGANPDPWTKRRLHSGAMIESGDGATHRNFELLATKGSQIAHYWRDNTASGFPWATGGGLRQRRGGMSDAHFDDLQSQLRIRSFDDRTAPAPLVLEPNREQLERRWHFRTSGRGGYTGIPRKRVWTRQLRGGSANGRQQTHSLVAGHGVHLA